MANRKPTIHHLNDSQSQRILWLLEELNIPYNLVLHERNLPTHPTAPFLSPPSLRATGHYGKAPLLITSADEGTRSIPESSAIATYLIRTYDTEDKFGLKNGDWIRDEVLTSMAISNLTRAEGMKLMLDLGAIRNGAGPGGKRFDGAEMKQILRDLEMELKTGPKGGYFMGENPGRADIMMEFPMSMIKQRNWIDLKKDFPALDEWLERVYARDAFKRSLEKGNGYNLNTFPQRPRL